MKKVGAGKTAMPTVPAGLLVCNHVSWLDIFVINALAPTAFVSKDDVRRWPLIGWLCAGTETIFLERGSRAAAQRTGEHIVRELAAGAHVGIFPEGTTSDGTRLLPFHAAFFQCAIDAAVPVVPLALRYQDAAGQPSRAPAYDGELTLWQTLLAITRAEGLLARVAITAPIAPADLDRRQLAAHCHRAIALFVEPAEVASAIAGQTTPSPLASPIDHKEPGTRAGLRGAPPSDSPPTDSPNPAPAACLSA